MKQRRVFGLLVVVFLLIVGSCGVWLYVQQRQYPRNQKLINAVLGNDTKTALALINAGADPNARPDQPLTFGFRVLVDRLLHRSPAAAGDDSTAFLYACGSGLDNYDYEFYVQEYQDDNYDLVKTMLAHGADLRLRSPADHTALWGAIRLNRSRVVKLLLEHGANVNEQYKYGVTPLMEAIQRQADLATLLLSHNPAVNTTDDSGDTALHRAAWQANDLTLFHQLLAHGADPTLRNKSGRTAIEIAQEAHHLGVVELLQRSRKAAPPPTNHR